MTGYVGWNRAAYRPAWSLLTPENKLNGDGGHVRKRQLGSRTLNDHWLTSTYTV
jgi:hypothetical protein